MIAIFKRNTKSQKADNLCLKVYDKDWQAQTKTQLIRRIRNKLKDFDQKELQTLMKGIRQNSVK